MISSVDYPQRILFFTLHGKKRWGNDKLGVSVLK
ncbi:hypothetical protein EcE24377A_1696 [Escherichia coli O139:H28 str. E24377A]|uniref:Uncharacterized protein n=1 Tax=Escherichia coli O139:H28 (strain E24377A / ETEC) TaxID=331111 RepID=A7ZLV3_ECO24|nr:hypothetical protein EcE24377A_1696 [Escherichia coli O139:H28 str. E24377A]